MRFDVYLKTQIKKDFAKKLGISLRALAYYASGERPMPLAIALEVQRITQKKVTVTDIHDVYLKAQGQKLIANIASKRLCKSKKGH